MTETIGDRIKRLRLAKGLTQDELGVKAVGREVGLHELRHMVATALIRAHLDDATIANALGHRNADFTRRIYADIYDDSRQQVAAVTAALVDIQ